jgi:methionyl-tRNA formyltransferase
VTALRLVFMGTPDFAAVPLRALIDQGYDIAAVYTRPPQKSGRGMALQLSPVHQVAQAHHLAVETPTSLKTTDAAQRLADYQPDLAIVVAYGMLLPAAILQTPRLGCWNIHASLLPRWRGAAPIQRAVMAGDTETGVCIMQMDEGLDTGPVLRRATCPITAGDNAQKLHDKLAILGSETLLQTLAYLSAGALTRADAVPQNDHGMSYAAKIDKAEAAIDWTCRAHDIYNLVRGLSPFPGAWFSYQNTRIKLLEAELDPTLSAPAGTVINDAGWIACGTGAIRPVTLQRAGKTPMDFSEFCRGMPLPTGTVLSCNATS